MSHVCARFFFSSFSLLNIFLFHMSMGLEAREKRGGKNRLMKTCKKIYLLAIESISLLSLEGGKLPAKSRW